MSRRANLRLNVRRVGRAVRRLASEFISPPRYTDGPSTADWHQPPTPGHPSLLCRCEDARYFHAGADIEHAQDCEWLKYQCRECKGTGHCQRCMGDGCDPEPAPSKENR